MLFDEFNNLALKYLWMLWFLLISLLWIEFLLPKTTLSKGIVQVTKLVKNITVALMANIEYIYVRTGGEES